MSLEKAISIAMENNYGIQIAEKSIAIAENNDTWARAGKYPTIDLNGQLGGNLTNDNNPASFLQGSYFSGALGASLDAQWLVYAGGRVKIAKEQLESLVAQQQLAQKTQIHDLMKQVIQAYNAVLFQQARMDVLQQSLDLSYDRYRYEETKKDYGASNSYNIIQFENAIYTDSINLASQSAQLEVAKRNLHLLLNEEDYTDYAFNERLAVSAEPLDINKLKEIMSEENYTLKTLSMINELNALNTALEEASRKPTVSLNGNVGIAENAFQFYADNPMTGEPFGLLFSERINGGLSANVNWNLYDGGLRKTNIQNAKLQEEMGRLDILEARAAISNQLDILATNYSNQLLILQLADEQVALSQKNLDMTEARFKNGQLSSLDFRNVQNQYLTALFNKVNAMYNLMLTQSEVDFLVGRFG